MNMPNRSKLILFVALTLILGSFFSASLWSAEKKPLVQKETENYSLSMTLLPDAGNAEQGVINIVLKAKAGNKVNRDFPIKIKTDGSVGITLSKSVFTKEDVKALSDHELVADLHYSLSGGEGKAAAKLVFRFGTCKLNAGGEVTSCQFFTEEQELLIRP
jgi:hypothetical protein